MIEVLYEVGHELEIQGVRYLILGSIAYTDSASGDYWEEYRLRNLMDGHEHWLSVDQGNGEYEMSQMVIPMVVPSGFRLVDSGTQRVSGRYGSVDVDPGETARYETYEDASEEHTFCIERWSDETEYSRGMYIGLSDIQDMGQSASAAKVAQGSTIMSAIATVGVTALILSPLVMPSGSGLPATTDVASYLASSESYSYETALSDNGENAQVYSSTLTVDEAAKDIIANIEGNTEGVQEDDDARTVAILTPNEYVLVYEDAGEDGMGLGDAETASTIADELGSSGDEARDADETPDANEATETETETDGEASTTTAEDKWMTDAEGTTAAEGDDATLGRTLVQVSSRKYAYATDRRPYHARYRSYRWYRRYYRSKGYEADRGGNSDSPSSYGNYTGETAVDSSTTSAYESYADSIRQESIGSRSSSNGGTSYGK